MDWWDCDDRPRTTGVWISASSATVMRWSPELTVRHRIDSTSAAGAIKVEQCRSSVPRRVRSTTWHGSDFEDDGGYPLAAAEGRGSGFGAAPRALQYPAGVPAERDAYGTKTAHRVNRVLTLRAPWSRPIGCRKPDRS